jgi:anthranilate phosphoribosyltransferase
VPHAFLVLISSLSCFIAAPLFSPLLTGFLKGRSRMGRNTFTNSLGIP